jgi:acyl-CoA synthetase (NDP forming)
MSTMTESRRGTTHDRAAVGEVLDAARAEGRTSLSAPEAKRVCDAYGIDVPRAGLASSAEEAVALAEEI